MTLKGGFKACSKTVQSCRSSEQKAYFQSEHTSSEGCSLKLCCLTHLLPADAIQALLPIRNFDPNTPLRLLGKTETHKSLLESPKCHHPVLYFQKQKFSFWMPQVWRQQGERKKRWCKYTQHLLPQLLQVLGLSKLNVSCRILAGGVGLSSVIREVISSCSFRASRLPWKMVREVAWLVVVSSCLSDHSWRKENCKENEVRKYRAPLGRIREGRNKPDRQWVKERCSRKEVAYKMK